MNKKIEENEIELELKSSKNPKSEEKNVNKARRQRFSEDVEREEIILEAPNKSASCGEKSLER